MHLCTCRLCRAAARRLGHREPVVPVPAPVRDQALATRAGVSAARPRARPRTHTGSPGCLRRSCRTRCRLQRRRPRPGRSAAARRCGWLRRVRRAWGRTSAGTHRPWWGRTRCHSRQRGTAASCTAWRRRRGCRPTARRCVRGAAAGVGGALPHQQHRVALNVQMREPLQRLQCGALCLQAGQLAVRAVQLLDRAEVSAGRRVARYGERTRSDEAMGLRQQLPPSTRVSSSVCDRAWASRGEARGWGGEGHARG